MAVTVTITRDPQNTQNCVSNPDPFHASPGDDVTFVFQPTTEGIIAFGSKTPFVGGEAAFRVGTGGITKRSKGNVNGTFPYTVVWIDAEGGGMGNGSGIFP